MSRADESGIELFNPRSWFFRSDPKAAARILSLSPTMRYSLRLIGREKEPNTGQSQGSIAEFAILAANKDPKGFAMRAAISDAYRVTGKQIWKDAARSFDIVLSFLRRLGPGDRLVFRIANAEIVADRAREDSQIRQAGSDWQITRGDRDISHVRLLEFNRGGAAPLILARVKGDGPVDLLGWLFK